MVNTKPVGIVGVAAAALSGVTRGATLELAPGVGLTPRRAEFGELFGLLLAVTALVLLTACANATSLLLVRADARRRDVAISRALGASRARLVRAMLTESLLLALLASIAGMMLACALSFAIEPWAPRAGATFQWDLHPDARVLAVPMGLAMVTGLLFGLLPAVQSSRRDVALALRGLTSAARGGRGSRLGSALVVAQVGGGARGGGLADSDVPERTGDRSGFRPTRRRGRARRFRSQRL
jgi:hypothetical protein